MKINNYVVKAPKVEFLVIPKGNTDCVFKAKVVTNWDEFEKFCPVPVAPSIMKRGETVGVSDTSDKGYIKALDKWAQYKMAWLFIDSISATDGLEWDTVNMKDPDTWVNYLEDLKKAGFFENEVARLLELVSISNGLNSKKMDEATERFLAEQEANL